MSNGFDKAMQDALFADAEKLSQLTGEDHTPVFLADCLCGVDFCEICGDCLHCYGDLQCVVSPDGKHMRLSRE